MRLLRLRILCFLLALGLVPLTLLLAGLYWLPSGFVSLAWYGMLGALVIAVSVGLSGHVVRPARALAAAFDHMLRTGGEQKKPSRWLPADFSRVQRAFAVFLKDARRSLDAAQAEAQRNQMRFLEEERRVRQAHAIVSAVLGSVRDGILVADPAGSIIASNFPLDAILGEPLENVSGRSAEKFFQSFAAKLEDAAPFDDLLAKTASNPLLDSSLEATAKDGAIRSLAIRTAPLKLDASGDIAGRIWIFRDTTEQKHLAEKLQQAQKMEAMGQLAGGIAHDFNNLLTAIRGNLLLAQMSSPDAEEEVREKLQGATHATVRAAELVKQLLGFSRKGAPVLKPIDLNKTASDVENILRHSIDPRVSIISSHGDDLWTVEADPVQIEQVILNICLNARDSLPESGGIIEISTENFTHEKIAGGEEDGSAEADFVRITVRDNGCGIPKDLQGHIFEPFFTTKTSGKGTGLGLAMAKEIVAEHGGWIEFESEEGKGAEFRICLPRTHAEKAVVEEDPKTGELERANDKNGSVLVVDDESSVRSIAVNMLKYLGYTVTEAADGQEALDKVADAETPFDAILLDIYMPKLSGRDTFKKLRASGCDTPVVVCSGFMLDPDEFMALSEGGSSPADIIQKPYSMEVLAKAIAKAIASGSPAMAA